MRSITPTMAKYGQAQDQPRKSKCSCIFGCTQAIPKQTKPAPTAKTSPVILRAPGICADLVTPALTPARHNRYTRQRASRHPIKCTNRPKQEACEKVAVHETFARFL